MEPGNVQRFVTSRGGGPARLLAERAHQAPAHAAAASGGEDAFQATPPLTTAEHNAQVLSSLSAAQRSYVQQSYGDLLQRGRRLDVSAPAGNGAQPVLTWQRAELAGELRADPARTFSVHTHYHGDIRPENPVFLDRATIVDAMERKWEADPSAVFVLPQTQVFGDAQGSQPVGTQLGFTAWKNVRDQKETTESALRSAGLDPGRVGRRTLSAHSSGGYPLARVMAATAREPHQPRVEADHIVIMDTVRGDLADPRVGQWFRESYPAACTYVDGTMHAFTSQQAASYGWRLERAADHFDAVKSFFHLR